MEYTNLGSDGPRVSRIGLGCMGMSEFYGRTDDQTSKKVILKALEQGITMLDTADTYGNGHNERLIADVIKDWSDDLFIATKFGIVRKNGSYERKICGRPEYVKEAVENSLERLNIETIDLYYIHRVDADVPIEETMGALANLVQQGKIKYIGISEPSIETVLKAHAVHPVTCIQSEYSLFTRDVEKQLPILRENHIGMVAYSPLGRGMLTGKLTKETMADDTDFRKFLPRTGENFDENIGLVNALKEISDSKGITPAQLALGWLLSRGDDVIPIPGTRNIKYLMDNMNAVDLVLQKDEIEEIESVVRPDLVKGERYTKEGMKGVNG